MNIKNAKLLVLMAKELDAMGLYSIANKIDCALEKLAEDQSSSETGQSIQPADTEQSMQRTAPVDATWPEWTHNINADGWSPQKYLQITIGSAQLQPGANGVEDKQKAISEAYHSAMAVLQNDEGVKKAGKNVSFKLLNSFVTPDNKTAHVRVVATKYAAQADHTAQIKQLQKLLGVQEDGVWGPEIDRVLKFLGIRKGTYKNYNELLTLVVQKQSEGRPIEGPKQETERPSVAAPLIPNEPMMGGRGAHENRVNPAANKS